jgi:hypothetical protein
VRLPSPASPASPGDLARTAERLNGPGARALAALSDREILGAWEATVAAFLDPGSPERRALSDRSRFALSDRSRRELGVDLAPPTRLSPEGLEAGLYWQRATTQGAYWAMGLGVAAWLPMEFIAPEAALPPQFAGFLMSIVGMVLGSLLSKAEAQPAAQ